MPMPSSFIRSMRKGMSHYYDDHQFLIILNKTNLVIAKTDKIMQISELD